ncbi:hypothetical protein E4P42_01515 [Mycobacterium sp. PS03-16]|nr:hypothetical protein E4P42_01515 [Mycobacterium sp. PS03-16]
MATIQRSPFAGPAPAEERTARRLVVQPPLPARDTVTSRLFDTAAPSPALVADSPKPMSLQRIFARPAAPATPGDDAPSGAPATVTQHDGYTEVSFAPAQVQREAEETGESDAPAAPPAAQDAAPTSAAAVPPAPSPAPAGPNIDELVNRLYDPLAARLRSELWLDRERAGALMDVRR